MQQFLAVFEREHWPCFKRDTQKCSLFFYDLEKCVNTHIYYVLQAHTPAALAHWKTPENKKSRYVAVLRSWSLFLGCESPTPDLGSFPPLRFPPSRNPLLPSLSFRPAPVGFRFSQSGTPGTLDEGAGGAHKEKAYPRHWAARGNLIRFGRGKCLRAPFSVLLCTGTCFFGRKKRPARPPFPLLSDGPKRVAVSPDTHIHKCARRRFCLFPSFFRELVDVAAPPPQRNFGENPASSVRGNFPTPIRKNRMFLASSSGWMHTYISPAGWDPLAQRCRKQEIAPPRL